MKGSRLVLRGRLSTSGVDGEGQGGESALILYSSLPTMGQIIITYQARSELEPCTRKI